MSIDYMLSAHKAHENQLHPRTTTTTTNMNVILNALNQCLPCVSGILEPAIKIKGVRYKIVRLLGQGGFSYVYLVSPTNDPSLFFALKKIHCVYGSSDATFQNAMREIRNYHRFSSASSPFVIKSLDEVVIRDSKGSQTFYILLPYFEQSLQDIINSNLLNDKHMDESEIIKLCIGVLRGLQVLHGYTSLNRDSLEYDQLENQIFDGALDTVPGDVLEPLLDSQQNPIELDGIVPYAHRDLKPANIMLSAEGLPVLVDLGSCAKARVLVSSRQQALILTDYALEHCTLPYRAPELLEVEKNAQITEATDIWSLGCVLYACCFGFSPFEKLELEQGANLKVAISRGKFSFPSDTKGYSPSAFGPNNQLFGSRFYTKTHCPRAPRKRPSTSPVLVEYIVLNCT